MLKTHVADADNHP